MDKEFREQRSPLLIVQEVLESFNTRSDSGRVVVNPPNKMSPLKLRSTGGKTQFCCGRAFLTEESFAKHQEQSPTHGKPIDLKNIRSALNPRSSLDFWKANKGQAAKNFNEEGEEMEMDQQEEEQEVEDGIEEEGDADEIMGNYEEQFDIDEDNEEEAQENGDDYEDMPQLQQVQPKAPQKKGKAGRKAKGKKSSKTRPYLNCHICNLSIPGTNMKRHLRTCHNPKNPYVCSFCPCRFVQPYGRLLHQTKSHGISLAEGRRPRGKSSSAVPKVPTVTSAALKVKRKLITNNLHVKKPAIQMAESTIPPSMENDLQTNITKLPDGAGHQCKICQKVFNGSNNARDHLNSHFQLKPYKCTLCNYTFSFRSNVSRHIRTCHANNSDFICPFGCGCSMVSQASLTIHVNLVCTLRNKFSHLKPPSSRAKVKKPVVVKQEPSSLLYQALNVEEYDDSQIDEMNGIGEEEMMNLNHPVQAVVSLSEKFKYALVGPQLYFCKMCDKNISGACNFRDHMNIHSGIRPFKCPMCSMRFTFKSNIKRHVGQCHIEGGEYPCQLNCGCVMGNLGALNSHMNKCKQLREGRFAPTLGPIRVKKEPLAFSNFATPPQPQPPKMMQMNSPSSTGNASSSSATVLPRPPPLTPSPFLQNRGSNSTTTSFNANPAVKYTGASAGTGAFECHLCGKRVSNKRNLRNHIRTHSGLKPFKCAICNLAFTARESLKKHENRSHAPDAKFRCSKCPCQFQHNQGLLMHIRLHHTKHPPTATKNFLSGSGGSGVNAHQNQVRNDGAIDTDKYKMVGGKFKCNLCGKLLQTPHSFRNHLLIHSGDKPYSCEHCGASFRLYSTMYDHKKSSHSGGHIKCDICPCSFQNELGLRRHHSIFHGPQRTISNFTNYIQNRAKNIRKRAALTLQVKVGPRQLAQESAVPQMKRRFITSTNANINPTVSSATQNFTQGSTSTSRANAMFQCGHCGIALASLFDLSEHQKEHASGKKQSPATPPVTIKQEPGGTKTSGGSANAPLTKAASLKSLDLDLKAIAKGLLPHPKTCPLCFRLQRKRDHFVQHMKACHNGGDYQCSLCTCQFVSQGSLSRHYRQSHPEASEKDKKNGGLVAGAGATPSPDKPATMSSSSAPKSIKVEASEKSPSRNVAQEKLRPPQIITKAFFKCHYCEKIFDQQWVYNQHVLIHTNVKPHECSKCGQMFRTTGILAQHTKTSHGGGSFQCSRCTCVFQTEKGLSVHTFVYHKGGREGLKGGKKKEPGEPPRTPTPRGSNSNNSKAQLSRTSTSTSNSASTSTATASRNGVLPIAKPIKCQLCGKSCLGPGNLSLHMKSHHNVGHTYEPSIEMPPPPKLQPAGRTYSAEAARQKRSLAAATSRQSQSYQGNYSGNGVEEYSTEEMEEEESNFEIVGYENYNSYDQQEEEQYEENYEEDYYGEELEQEQEEVDGDQEVEEYNGYAEEYDDDQAYEEEDDQGIEIEMDDPRDHIRNYEHQDVNADELLQPISCRACSIAFDTRDSFAFHIESGSTNEDTFRCPYCCMSGVTMQNLSTHIDEFHPMDEIEYLESQIYADS